MTALTQEQQALRKLARQAAAFADDPTDPRCSDFVDSCGPHEVVALLAQLEASQADYNCAVDSVAQLQEEVFAVRAKLEAAPGEPAQEWKPLTAPGQVKVGTKLRFTIGDDKYSEKAKLILHPGTDKEEIIYNKGKNYYLITSVAIEKRGQRNCEFLATTAEHTIRSVPRVGGMQDAPAIVAVGEPQP
jgi:hypothetical protein